MCADLVWSDPEDVDTWAMSPRGAGWLFGAKVTAEVRPASTVLHLSCCSSAGKWGVVSSCGTDSALKLINCQVKEPVQNIFAVSEPTEQILPAPVDRGFIDKGRAEHVWSSLKCCITISMHPDLSLIHI